MIYICIPAHNEDHTVGVVLWKIRQVMLDFPRDYQILVLDDASTDDTAEVLAPYARVLPLTVLRNEERLGYARSLEKLLREAVRRSTYPRRDVVVTLQADFTDEPADIPALIRRIESGADIVAGASRTPQGAPLSIRWSRLGLGYLARRLPWPEPVTDPLTGFRAYRVVTLKRAIQERGDAPLLTREGWAANAELLRVVSPYARRIAEATVEHRYDRHRRETRFQPWQTFVQLLGLPRTRVPARRPDDGSPARSETRSGAGTAVGGGTVPGEASPRAASEGAAANGGPPERRRNGQRRRRRGPPRTRNGSARQSTAGEAAARDPVNEGDTDE